jgi:hypothetical protein
MTEKKLIHKLDGKEEEGEKKFLRLYFWNFLSEFKFDQINISSMQTDDSNFSLNANRRND